MAANRFKKSIESIEQQENAEKSVSKTDILPALNQNKGVGALSDILENAQKENYKNVTLYLSLEVDEATSLIAKQNGISKSKLVDSVLKKVLLPEVYTKD